MFYLQNGKIEVRFSQFDDIKLAEIEILLPGDSFHVSPLIRHQMKALEESDLFEFSTQHFEEDSYRIERGD